MLDWGIGAGYWSVGADVWRKVVNHRSIFTARTFGRVFVILAALFGAVIASPVTANVDLFFQPSLVFSPAPGCTVNQILTVQLRARSSTASPQQFSALSVILEWDPAVLEFMENIPNSNPNYLWTSEFYPAGGLNPDYSDGDASYYALPQTFNLPVAPANNTNGMLVTTFRFKVLAPTNGTLVRMIADRAGELTQVSDNDANDVTGDISSTSTFKVANACDCALGDVNLDSAYDLLDIAAAVEVLLGNDTDPSHVNAVDADCDGDADGNDIQGFTDFMLLAL
ncbi:MAG: hypothetical protein HBSAPP02_20250 [Phycisphaerae bacterium]|nr:MAG: hypothetical protein HBSAPP02_20250 [Phycisphaerae bacterium]